MTTENTESSAQVRQVLEDWAQALRAMDIDGIMACQAPDLVSFDCHSQLQFKGAPAYRAFLEACFPYMKPPVVFEMHELDVTAEGNLAFCRYIARIVATGTDGTEHPSWMRATVCLRRTKGKWLVVHGHLSAPFDPMTEKVMLGLKPE